MTNMTPRIDDFRARLVARIPCWPDKQTVRAELEQKRLDEVLRIYLNWTRRFIPSRPRAVSFGPGFWDTPLAKSFGRELADLEAKIRSGKDLTPHLSDLVNTHGFVPARYSRKGRLKSPEWEDKDYALNAYDAHHLHLTPNGKGDELLYGLFRRDAALLLFVGDHQSFDDGSIAAAVSEVRADADHFVLKGILGPAIKYTPKERNELARRGITTITQVGEKSVTGPLLTAPGYSLPLSRFADQVMFCLLDADEKLDDVRYVDKLFARAPEKRPDLPKFAWEMRDCDLILVEVATRTGICFLEGPL